MKSSKWILGLTVIVLMMALAPSSFAQIQLQIFNSPSSAEVQTNHMAQISDPSSPGSGITISGSLIANSTLTTTTLTLTFPGPITSSGVSDGAGGAITQGAIPTSDPIVISGQSGVFASLTAVTTINYTGGTISITLPGFGTLQNTQSGSFRINGIKIDVNGKTAPLNLTSASLSSGANNYFAPSTLPALVNTLVPGIGSMTQTAIAGQPNNGTFLIFTNQTTGTFADGAASVVIQEGAAGAWRTAQQSSTSLSPVTNGTNIRLTVAGIPSGVTLAISTTGSSSTLTAAFTSLALKAPSSTAPTQNQTTISFSATSLTTQESLQLQLTLSGTPTGLAAGAITLTATMAPIGDAFDTTTTPGVSLVTVTGGYPRFAQADVGPLTIGTITTATTTLLIPYALSGFGNYNTGIAIANTSADPFGGAVNGGAVPGGGTIAFTFFPNAGTGLGTGISYSTATTGRPGGGMDSSGSVPAGSTFAALLGDLLTAAGRTGDFQGYAFAVANFLDAHGVAYIYQGPVLTSAVPILVVPPPIATSRNGLVESLNN